MALTSQEVNRKLLHIISGSLMPLGIFYIPRLTGWSKWSPVIILVSMLVPSIAVEMLRIKFAAVQKIFYRAWRSVLRGEEDRKITGWTWVFSGACICAILFVNKPYISFIALSLFIMGDAVAALVGLSVGRIKIGKKSLEGSAGCFAFCCIVIFAVFPAVPGVLDAWNGRMPVVLGIIIALSITLQELFPIRVSKQIEINDNLSVPVLTGVVILVAEKLF